MSSAAKAIFLFDVDGVLVDPRAYKIGVGKTLEFLLAQTTKQDLSTLLPDEADFAFMESRGIHDVWDMCNIMFALFVEQAWRTYASEFYREQFPKNEILETLHAIRALSPTFKRPDYRKFAEQITLDHKHPPDNALALISQSAQFAQDTNTSAWTQLLKGFLQSTRSVYGSFGTLVFQNIILGDAVFESTYQLQRACSSPSLIKTEDIVLLDAQMSAKILQLNKQQSIHAGIYTARPSLPPPDIEERRGFSPEAEMAAEAAGLGELPLVGMGMMEWLASEHGERTEDLTKPNTTHSLSALIATLKADRSSRILELAYAYNKEKNLESTEEISTLLKKVNHIFVFEDTISGIKPMRAMSSQLNDAGFAIQISPLGIARDAGKKSALEPNCEKVFDDINQALEYAFSKLKL
jgi:hypothetical protein